MTTSQKPDTPLPMGTSLRTEHNESVHFRALRLLEHNPQLSQRELARQLGISVGKTNFLLKALVDRGFVTFHNFQQGDQKLKKLAYLLTPEGIQHRLSLTRSYLELKSRQYEALQAELASLRTELEADDGRGQPLNPSLDAGHPADVPHP